MLVTLELVKDVKYVLEIPIMISYLQNYAYPAQQEQIPPRKEVQKEQIVIKLVRKYYIELHFDPLTGFKY